MPNVGTGTTIRQGAIPDVGSGNNFAIFVQDGAGLECVMDPPQAPHTRSEVRIKVAVKDGIAHRLIAISATVVYHL